MIIGAAFGLASLFALAPGLAAFGSVPGIALAVVAVGAILGFFAPTIRRAFGRGFLLLGACVFALPLSAMLLSGRVANEMITASDGEATTVVGAGIAGVAMTGIASFVGFFFGAILLVIGLVLVLGGRREVIVVAPKPSKRTEPTL